ncbi:MAG: hypothetical protein EOM12_10765 [Verrucomicrobiae bacterium]|nr:hypothetical protein [Verrucomicrobiae bacterium]
MNFWSKPLEEIEEQHVREYGLHCAEPPRNIKLTHDPWAVMGPERNGDRERENRRFLIRIADFSVFPTPGLVSPPPNFINHRERKERRGKNHSDDQCDAFVLVPVLGLQWNSM